MFRNFSLALLLFASLGFAQVTTVGENATTAGPAVTTVPVNAANAPLISTPDIALPGSGPAMGAPISSSTENDSRSSRGPSVYNPNSMPVPESTTATVATIPSASAATTSTSTSTAPTSASTTAPTTTEPFENGIQHFESGLPNPSNPNQSLAQIARAYRAQHRQAAKTFNNDSIAQLNARGVRTGNLGPETSTVVAGSQPAQPAQPTNAGTLMAQSQAPAMPQSDQYQVARSTISSPAASSTAWQQRHKSSEQTSPSASQNANPTQQEASSAASPPAVSQASNKQSAALPQTSSPLPLLLLLGGLGVVGGVLYWLRR